MTSVQVLSLFFAVATVVTAQASDYPEGNAPEKRNSSDIYETISISYPWFVAIDVPPDGFVNARMSSPWLGRPEIVCASMDEVQDLSTAILGEKVATIRFEKIGIWMVIRQIFESGACGYAYSTIQDVSRPQYVGEITIGEFSAKTIIFPVRAERTEMIDPQEALNGYVFQMWLVSWPGK